MRGRNWTENEVGYLQDHWGYMAVRSIAVKLNRSNFGIIMKAKRIGLKGAYQSGDRISAYQASCMLGVDSHTVTDYWILKCGLKAKKPIMRLKRKIYLIDFETLLNWLKNNPDKWDSRRVKPLGLGMEYDWLKEKRILDSYQPKRRLQKWTTEEISKLKFYCKQGKKIKEIAVLLDRSYNAVERKSYRLRKLLVKVKVNGKV